RTVTGESRAVVTGPNASSRLTALCTEYARLKPDLDALTDRVREISEAIKVEAGQQAWGCSIVDIDLPGFDHTLRVQTRVKWQFDVKRFKADEPESYVRYAVRRQVTELRRVAR